MRLKSFFFFTALCFVQFAFGQKVNISGKIMDKATSSPIEYASVSLLSKDSTFIKGINSDEKGNFIIDNTKGSDCLLSVSYLGYETAYVPVEKTEDDNNLGNIVLQPSSVALDGITVTAQSVINKPDRKLITPSESQVKTSTNGIDLLQRLQLPRITIDHINNTIKASGNGEVQLRINGVQVTNAEIVALRPEDIIRIEYHDSPGARYGNAAAVLDYITRRKESGGNINGNLSHGINETGFVDDYISAKFNHKKSEFSVNAYWNNRKIDWTRTNDEVFTFPDKKLHRIEEGLPTLFEQNSIWSAANYSLAEKDKYLFNVTIRYNFSDVPHSFSDRKSTMITSENPDPVTVTDYASEKSNSPALDVYYQHRLKNDQLIIFNIVGTYISSTNRRNYEEIGNNSNPIYSHISGDKYSLIGEGIYEKKLSTGKITAGLKHSQTYTNNKYTGDITTDVSMKQAESYAYAEYQFKKGKFNYMANLGVTRSYYSQSEDSQEKYSFRPSAQITYDITDNTFLRYRSNIWSSTPSLSELNNVEQQIDQIQIRRGNPNLKSNWGWSNYLTFGHNSKLIDIEFYGQYTYRDKPVMESIYFEDDVFVKTPENQKKHHHLNFETTIKFKPWKDHISIYVNPGINRFISQGNNYTHTYNNEYINGGIDLMYKSWMLSFWGCTSWNWFYGETVNEGETLYMVSAGYKKPNFSVMIGSFNPFGGSYKRKDENLSSLAYSRSSIYTDAIKQLFTLKVSFNFNFGRQYSSGDKRLDNKDSDSGIMSGAKK